MTGTYNQGVILGGLVDLWDLTRNDNATNTSTHASYLSMAVDLASSAMGNLKDDNGVLHEARNVGWMDESQRNFKGVFVQHLAYLASRILANKAEAFSTPINVPDCMAPAAVDRPTFMSQFKEFLVRNYQAVISLPGNKDTLSTCSSSSGLVWQASPEAQISAGYMSTQSVLNLFIAYDAYVTAV